MNNELTVILDIDTSSGLNDFSQNAKVQNCIYYASDVLNKKSGKASKKLETVIQHTIHVFNTLEMKADEHFYSVYRCDPDHSNNLYRDWKLSELACIYLSLKGDPTDLKTIAQQQTNLIDGMLNYMHTQQYQVPNRT